MAMRVAVLLSGSGTTLQNLIDRAEDDSLDIEIVCVIASRDDAYGLERARQHGITHSAIPRKDFGNSSEFSDAVWTEIRKHNVGLVVLAGFMSLLSVPKDFEHKIINIHPALIPSFSGKGMFGHHVHEAVVEYGVRLTGATVHFVDELYDNGPIILQEAVPVFEADTADDVAERVQAKEREIYPRAIQLFATDRIRLNGRKVIIT